MSFDFTAPTKIHQSCRNRGVPPLSRNSQLLNLKVPLPTYRHTHLLSNGNSVFFGFHTPCNHARNKLGILEMRPFTFGCLLRMKPHRCNICEK